MANFKQKCKIIINIILVFFLGKTDYGSYEASWLDARNICRYKPKFTRFTKIIKIIF